MFPQLWGKVVYSEIAIVQWLSGSTVCTLSIEKVVLPQRPDFLLSADVPDGELDILVFYRFHIEACKTFIFHAVHKLFLKNSLRALDGCGHF